MSDRLLGGAIGAFIGLALLGLMSCAQLLPQDAQPTTPKQHLLASEQAFTALVNTATVAVQAGMIRPGSTMGEAIRAAVQTGNGALEGAQRAVTLGDNPSSLYWLSVLDGAMRSLRISLIAAQAANVKDVTDPGLTPDPPPEVTKPVTPDLVIPDVPPPIQPQSYAPQAQPAPVETAALVDVSQNRHAFLPEPVKADVIVEVGTPVGTFMQATRAPLRRGGYVYDPDYVQGGVRALATVGE